MKQFENGKLSDNKFNRRSVIAKACTGTYLKYTNIN